MFVVTRDILTTRDMPTHFLQLVLTTTIRRGIYSFLVHTLYHRQCFLRHSLVLGTGNAVEDLEAVTLADATGSYIGDARSNIVLKLTQVRPVLLQVTVVTIPEPV